MLKTCENCCVCLHPYENYHKLIIGKSGCGKTWYATRAAEVSAAVMPILIVDISGSYIDSELKRNRINNKVRIVERNPKVQTTPLVVHSDFISNVADALIVTFEVKAMMQRRLLEEACTELLQENGCLTFQKLYEKLAKLENETDDIDRRKNIDFLLSRMFRLRNISTFQIVPGKSAYTKGIYIWQLSDFSDLIARWLAEFILEIEWKNIQASNSKERIQLILDEFQKLHLEHNAIEEMLREGRKYGLGLTMSSQFIPSGKEATNALEQAATCLYFQPNDRQLIATAKKIATQDYKSWIPILKHLERGSCILTGSYCLNHSSNISNRPIICKVDG